MPNNRTNLREKKRLCGWALQQAYSDLSLRRNGHTTTEPWQSVEHCIFIVLRLWQFCQAGPHSWMWRAVKKGGGWGCGRVNDNHNTTAARERIKFHIGPNVTSHLGPRNSGVGPCGERRGPELQTIQIHLDSLFNKSGIWIFSDLDKNLYFLNNYFTALMRH